MKQCLKTWLQTNAACNVKGLLLMLLMVMSCVGAWAADIPTKQSYMIVSGNSVTVAPASYDSEHKIGMMYIEDAQGNKVAPTTSNYGYTVGTGDNACYIGYQNLESYNSASITVDENIDLSNGYKLVLLTASSNELFNVNYSTSPATYTFNPSKAEAEYDYTFVSSSDAPVLNTELGSEYTNNTANKTLYVNDGATRVTVLGLAKQLQAWGVLGTPTSAGYDVSTPFYARISVKDSKGNIVSGLTYTYKNGYTSSEVSSDKLGYGDVGTYKSSKGIIYLVKDANNKMPSTNLDYTIDFSSLKNTTDTDFDIKSYTIECVFSREMPSVSSSIVAADPTLYAKVVFDIKDGGSLPFKHYEGYANKSGDYEVIDQSKGQLRQKTHEFNYYYYVDANTDVKLMLPFQYYETNGNDLEPKGYIRWYDWSTDMKSDYLKPFTRTTTDTDGNVTKSTNLLSEINDANGNSKGLFAYKMTADPVDGNIGVVFNTAEALTDTVTIACDVSRYIDGMDESKTFLEHEPTLSIRYIFHIMPKTFVADAIKNALVGTNKTKRDRTYEDNRKFTVGLKSTGAEATLRLNLNSAERYWFYPMSNATSHHVYTPNGSTIVANDFTITEPVHAKGVLWRIYDQTKQYYKDIQNTTTAANNSPRFYQLQLSSITNYGWKNVADGTAANDFSPSFTNNGDSLFVVAYLTDTNESGAQMCPVANFDVVVNSTYPMTKAAIDSLAPNRLYTYLDSHFTKNAHVTFDEDDKVDGSKTSDLSVPTEDNNMDNKPSLWNRRSYAFVYEDLMDYDWQGGDNHALSGKARGSIHGDYGFYKSANVTGVSTENEHYKWWQSGTLYDKTYENTNGAQYGKFMYVDASDESRDICTINFSTHMCVGTQLVFSANVADVTAETVKPQIVFKLYGIEADGSKTLLHNFSSGDFKSNLDKLTGMTWYQVYGKIAITDPAVQNYTNFAVLVDNYCSGTLGADYAIDDIRIYSRTAKVDVIQDKPLCGESETGGNIKLRLRAMHEVLNTMLQNRDGNVYFQIRNASDNTPATDASGNKIDYSYQLYVGKNTTPTTVSSGDNYGKVKVFSNAATLKDYYIGQQGTEATPDTVCMYSRLDDDIYVVLANKNFNLKAGQKYYVSVNYLSDSTGEKPDESNANNWGNPNNFCSVFSETFELLHQTAETIIEVDNKVVDNVTVECGTTTMPTVKVTAKLKTVDPYSGGSAMVLSDVKYVWYLDGTTEDKIYCDTKNNPVSEMTFSDLSLNSHTIYLKVAEVAGSQIKEGDSYVKLVVAGQTYYLCQGTQMEVKIDLDQSGPQMVFGFDGVTYPSEPRKVRIGLPQVKALVAKSATDGQGYLMVPVSSVSTAKIEFTDAKLLNGKTAQTVYLTGTNDPTYIINKDGKDSVKTNVVATVNVAELAAPTQGTQSTLGFRFDQNATDGVTFHEGYEYTVTVTYIDITDGKSESSKNCPGSTQLTFQIVPEYLDWNPTASDSYGAANNSANWNNDANWIRSKRSTLYKTAKNYSNYDEASTESSDVKIASKNTYVPMAFTKVTVPDLDGKKYFPYLQPISYAKPSADASVELATDLKDPKNDEATAEIEYAIMAYWDNSTNNGVEDGNTKCIPFYGNTCDQIYFKPGAELMNQQYLVYNKAWVEKEMTPDTWELVTSPLQDTYAGDMYVPVTSGRQETEAFEAINYSNTDNNRLKYAFSQRSWDNSSVKEYKYGESSSSSYNAGETGDASADKQTLKVVSSKWSHIYNDLAKAYTATEGVAIKAGDALFQTSATTKAMVRLPKADTSYKSYNYNGEEKGTSATLSKTNANKLQGAYSATTSENAVTVSLSNSTTDNGHYLVGNPYMTSISAYQFVTKNGLAQSISYYKDGALKQATLSESSDVVIAPMQSFFVQKKAEESAAADSYEFSADMAVARNNYAASASNEAKKAKGYRLSAKAANSKVTTTAAIVVDEEASEGYDDSEDVVALYDSELNNAATVYTVADEQAVSINSVPSVDWMPMGVIAATNEDVTLSLTTGEEAETIYLYDAKAKTYTELSDETEVSVKANEHGRYFISRSTTHTGGETTGINDLSGSDVKAYSPSAGLIVVTATTADQLHTVKVYSADGKLANNLQANGELSTTTRVAAGNYIVKATTQSGKQTTKKLVVR